MSDYRVERPEGEPVRVITTIGGSWGHNVDWLKPGERISGHLPRRPYPGDLLTSSMKPGQTGVYCLVAVEWTTDPVDMFFATVEPVGYTDDPEVAAMLGAAEAAPRRGGFLL